MKNRTNAMLLAVFLGGIGPHWFYLGKPIKGALYLVFCLTLIPAFIALVDAWGFYKLSESQFSEKYADAGMAMTSSGLATADTHVRCPDCRELIYKEARKCRFCGCSLVPQ